MKVLIMNSFVVLISLMSLNANGDDCAFETEQSPIRAMYPFNTLSGPEASGQVRREGEESSEESAQNRILVRKGFDSYSDETDVGSFNDISTRFGGVAPPRFNVSSVVSLIVNWLVKNLAPLLFRLFSVRSQF